MRRLRPALLIVPALWLAGCDMLGLESAPQIAARREAEGRAIGGACRHAARSIEACYEQNRRVDKAAIFAGWREMNDYMRENRLDAMPAPETTAVAAADTAGRPATAPAGLRSEPAAGPTPGGGAAKGEAAAETARAGTARDAKAALQRALRTAAP